MEPTHSAASAAIMHVLVKQLDFSAHASADNIASFLCPPIQIPHKTKKKKNYTVNSFQLENSLMCEENIVQP